MVVCFGVPSESIARQALSFGFCPSSITVSESVATLSPSFSPQGLLFSTYAVPENVVKNANARKAEFCLAFHTVGKTSVPPNDFEPNESRASVRAL